MRVLTWNINGIRTIPQYHPWNTLKSTQAILDHLEADIICFQEMKTSRQALEKSTAIPGPSYDSFFSFPSAKGGYSGVAVYTSTSTAIALKAEEGLSGTIPIPSPNPNQPFSDQRISTSYPLASSLPLFPDENGATPTSLHALDIEGRSLTLDFGLFVLINLYCPNETSDARFPFKMNFHLMLEERVRWLVEEEGREVVVVGDMNVCAGPEDHCEGYLQAGRGNGATAGQEEVEEEEGMEGIAEKWKGLGFWRHPAREWFRRWLDPEGGMLVDVVRKSWPERKDMYTCWNTRISARDSNYGTRIDYILVTRGLLPWVKGGDIMPGVKGSDHCPVWVDFWDEIEVEGKKVQLRDVMHMSRRGKDSSTSAIPADSEVEMDVVGESKVRGQSGEQDQIREPPRLAAKFWDEHSGKQTLLSTFFGKRGNVKPLRVATILAPITTHPYSDDPTPPPASPMASSNQISIVDLSTQSSSPPQSQSQSQSSPSPTPVSTPTLQLTPVSTLIHTTIEVAPAPEPLLPSQSTSKRKINADTPGPTLFLGPKSKKQKLQQQQQQQQSAGQAKLSSFFAKPNTGTGAGSRTASRSKSKPKAVHAPSVPKSSPESECTEAETNEQMDADYQLALQLSNSQDVEPVPIPGSSQPSSQTAGSQLTSNSAGTSKTAWTNLLAPLQPPKCIVHGEPAKELRVTKPGLNKGKCFFVCSRPVGPGYDKGKTERLREEVNPRWKCNFFKWASEVRREREVSTENNGGVRKDGNKDEERSSVRIV